MSNRTIFPDLQLFKKTVMERFLIAARTIYSNHPVYRYDEVSVADTKIHIEPTYANQNYEGKSPRLLVKVGQYEFSLQDTLGGNLMAEVLNVDGVIGGYSSIKNMTTMITIVVRAYAEEESSDLADELVLLGTYASHHMFSEMGLNIRGSAVSETRETDSQNDTFDTMVNFTVDVPWELKKFSGKLAVEPDPEIIIEDELIGGYRPPGIYVINGKFVTVE
jgi:hypothetical protein